MDPGFQIPAVTLFLKPSDPGQASLNQLLQDQQDPASPNFHHWLTPEEYADRFGASQSDITQISDWLKAQGLNVSSVARGRNAITVTGTADAVQNAFQTEIHRYQVDGVTHFANATDPSVPAAISVDGGGHYRTA